MEEIRKKHFWILISVLGFFFSAIITLLVYIWDDHKADQKEIFDRMDNRMIEVETYNHLLIKYVLYSEGIDLEMIKTDADWQRQLKKAIEEGKVGRTRGAIIIKDIRGLIADE